MKQLAILIIWAFFACITSIAQAEQMGELSPAETRTGTIDPASENDSFTFAGTAGQLAIIDMSSSGVDPKLRLYDEFGTKIADNFDFHGHTRIVYALTDTMIYTLQAGDQDGNNTGAYSLSLLFIPGPTTSAEDPQGGDIHPGESMSGKIDLPADSDLYTFTGRTDETVTIDMSASRIDPQITLYDSSGTRLARDYDFHGHARIEYPITTDGDYFIVVTDRDWNNTGTYSLSLDKIPGTQYSPSVRLYLNQEAVLRGETLEISAILSNGPSSVHLEAKCWLRFPDGRLMMLRDPHLTFGLEPDAYQEVAILTHTFDGTEQEGTYTIGIRFLDPRTGREISLSVETFNYTP